MCSTPLCQLAATQGEPEPAPHSPHLFARGPVSGAPARQRLHCQFPQPPYSECTDSSIMPHLSHFPGMFSPSFSRRFACPVFNLCRLYPGLAILPKTVGGANFRACRRSKGRGGTRHGVRGPHTRTTPSPAPRPLRAVQGSTRGGSPRRAREPLHGCSTTNRGHSTHPGNSKVHRTSRTPRLSPRYLPYFVATRIQVRPNPRVRYFRLTLCVASTSE